MNELGADKIVADVRDYSVYIDLEKRFILQDCPDWRRTAREQRRFCKQEHLCLHCQRMLQGVYLKGSKDSSGNSASIRGEGMYNKMIKFQVLLR